ncbi:MAG: hypothetical protein R6U27_13955 [Desulfobacterales bacterium]
MKLATSCFCILCLVIFNPPVSSLAEDTDIETMRQEIEFLKQRLESMEQRLQEAERKVAEPKAEKIREEKTEEVAKKEETENQYNIKIGGALRVNYAHQSFSEASESKKGDMAFDIFRLDIDGSYNDLLISAQYRWYSYQDVIHHGWIGYNFSEKWQGQLGVTQVPFGLLPYASHNWWFGVPYYVGLEDDYDMGLKLIRSDGPWDLQMAFFKNEEWGNASKLERYSYDVVRALGQENEETNQFNLRLAYTFKHGSFGSTELGVSGQWGQLYNNTTDDEGDHWAAAAHLNGFYGPFNLMLEAIRYEYNPENPPGIDNDIIMMGAFADAFPVAAEGSIYVANLSYNFPVDWGPITSLTFYDDYSILVKDESDFENSQINTLGCLISANPVYVYVDLIMGKNMIYLDGPQDSLAAGNRGHGWHTRFNVNVGYYF